MLSERGEDGMWQRASSFGERCASRSFPFNCSSPPSAVVSRVCASSARPPARPIAKQACPPPTPQAEALCFDCYGTFFRFPSLSSLPDSDTSLVAQHTQHLMIPSLSAAAPLFRSSAPVSLVGAAAAAAVVVVLARGRRSVRLSRRIRAGARCQIDEG